MESHLRVAIVPRNVPVSSREATQAAVDLGQALQDLSAATAGGSAIDIARAEDAYRAAEGTHKSDTRQDGYLARINGGEFPLIDFAVQYDAESGAPMLSLILAPDSLSIGEAATGPTPPSAPAAFKVSTWGGGFQPDSVGGQVASNAQRIALHTSAPMVRLHRNLGGEGGNVAVTA
jgi:hypothetical protein